MDWIQYVLIAFFVLFIVRRFFPVKGVQNLSADEVAERLKNPVEHTFIDVREIQEYSHGHIKGFKNIPLSQLSKRLNEIDRQKPVILTCKSGMRSLQAARILKKNGYKQISHLKIGIMGWHEKLYR